ncbi:MAG: winged helix-turn-helix domain-containing protein [Candidatus Geothermarchaeales archaeon]
MGEAEKVVFKSLGHPTRREIIRVIGEKGYATFTDLSALESKVGLLYYHLNIMSDLLYQDEDKRYILTELGRKAYELLVSGETLEAYVPVKAGIVPSLIAELATLRALFRYLTGSPSRFIVEAALLMGLIGWVDVNAKLAPYLLFPVAFTDEVDLIWGVTRVYVNWLLLAALSSILTYVIYRRGGVNVSAGILVGSAIAQTPLLIYAALWWLTPWIRGAAGLSMLLLLVFQTWSLWLLSSAISAAGDLTFRKSFLIALLVQYTSLPFVLYALA